MAIEDSVPFLDRTSEPVVLFAQDMRFGARASSLPERDAINGEGNGEKKESNVFTKCSI